MLVGHARERGALLGDHHLVAWDVRNRLTDLLKQRDRIEVFASAVDVRQPFAVAASVIEVQHAADRVDAQTVDVKLLEPVACVGHEEALHLRSAVIEQQSTPLLHIRTARIGMLVKRRAIEARKAVAVAREVRGHPVHDHADALFVGAVDQVLEIVGRAVARGRRIIAGHLIAPARVERIRHQRHELEVRIAHLNRIIDEIGRKIAIGKPLLPRAEVAFIDVHRRVVALAAAIEIRAVGPLERLRLPDHRRGAHRFAALRVRVRLHQNSAVVSGHGILIELSFLCDADQNLPYAGRADGRHLVGFRIPVVPITDDGNGARIRRPHGKSPNRFPIVFHQMTPQRAIRRQGFAFVEVIEFIIRQMRHVLHLTHRYSTNGQMGLSTFIQHYHTIYFFNFEPPNE